MGLPRKSLKEHDAASGAAAVAPTTETASLSAATNADTCTSTSQSRSGGTFAKDVGRATHIDGGLVFRRGGSGVCFAVGSSINFTAGSTGRCCLLLLEHDGLDVGERFLGRSVSVACYSRQRALCLVESQMASGLSLVEPLGNAVKNRVGSARVLGVVFELVLDVPATRVTSDVSRDV